MRSKANISRAAAIDVSLDQIYLPGPGAYDANKSIIKERTKSYGFGKSKKESGSMFGKNERPPVPGEYQVRDNKSKAPSFKIGGKSRE